MTLFELATAAMHKLPLKIVVLNNHYLGMVRQWQELFFENRESGVDLDRQSGLRASWPPPTASPAVQHQATRPTSRAWSCRRRSTTMTARCLIHAECVKTDNVFPMIPAGAALEDMITEPPKTQAGQADRVDLGTGRAAAGHQTVTIQGRPVPMPIPVP